MNLCRSLLVDIKGDGFSSKALRALTDGRKASPKLPFSRKDLNLSAILTSGRRPLSISGVQDKVGLLLDNGRFEVADRGSQYILKPVPSIDMVSFRKDIPANEHLTMQIASQLCGIETAANACVEMLDGEMAYLVRRFDYRDGEKIPQEDFAQLSLRSEETHGRNYKYDCSCEEAADVIKRFCPSYMVELPKFFRRIVFNYMMGNGDAHLKNFSLFATAHGDYVLTPAYDLLNTSLHIPTESAMALELFKDGYYTPSYEALGFYTRADFEEFARRIGVSGKIVSLVIDGFCSKEDDIKAMVGRSFLSSEAKYEYIEIFSDRLRALRNKGLIQ